MNPLKKFRQVGEVVVVCLALAILPFLPRRVILALAAGAGALGMRLARGQRQIGMANLDVAFGESLSRAEKERILRESFRTFARVMLDLFWFTRRTRTRIARWVRFDPLFDQNMPRDRAIVVTAHFGNWEILGQAGASRGFQVVSVAALVDNPYLTPLLNRMRRRTGQQVAERKGAVRVLLQALKKGAVVALLLDQNTSPAEGGVFVDFFGLRVPISPAAAALSARTGAPIVPVFCSPEADGSYRAYALPPFGGFGGEEAIGPLTQEIAARFEREIRSDPGKWLWTYKRWKYIPRGFARDKYPFYAHEVREEP